MTASFRSRIALSRCSRNVLRITSLLVTLTYLSFVQQTVAEEYVLGADSLKQEGVPTGRVTAHTWNKSDVFAGTERDYWVYVPAQYDGSEPACVMVFQDGAGYVGDNGHSRVPTVFDNLIHQKAMPVTIGIFVNPGRFPPGSGERPRRNRSVEYDTLSDAYARFLLEEILPEVGKENKLTDDPEGRAICGISSGGICAFTVAWERPDAFRKVISYVGSFTDIRGGHNYPSLIRRTEKNRFVSSYKTAKTTSTLRSGIGHWPIAKWRQPWNSPITNIDLKWEPKATMRSTAPRYSRGCCVGCGETIRAWIMLNRTVASKHC